MPSVCAKAGLPSSCLLRLPRRRQAFGNRWRRIRRSKVREISIQQFTNPTIQKSITNHFFNYFHKEVKLLEMAYFIEEISSFEFSFLRDSDYIREFLKLRKRRNGCNRTNSEKFSAFADRYRCSNVGIYFY